jgi:hypothetical protein
MNLNSKTLNYKLKISTMKTLNFDLSTEMLNDFVLSTEEMICVRGGDGVEPISTPMKPPVII